MQLSRRTLIKLGLLAPFASYTHAANLIPTTQPQKSWSIAVIPDTQYYVRSEKNAPIFTEITQWLVDHKQEHNIQLVLHVGDIVDLNETKQWENAKQSLQVLDGQLPYVLAVGNHDLGHVASDRSTMLNDYFSLSDNPLNQTMFGGFFEKGHLENAWYHFQYGNRDYIIFSLEFGPRKEVVEWANKIASQHSDKSLMLVTHEFIDQESTLFSPDGLPRHTTRTTKNSPYGYGIGHQGPIHCGCELWDSFISRHSNFELVFNGHYKAYDKTGPNPDDVKMRKNALATSYRSDTYDDGRAVHQMLFNAQWAPKGGDGWIRLLEFMPDETVRVKTLSPYLMRTANDQSKARKTTADMQFSFSLPLSKK